MYRCVEESTGPTHRRPPSGVPIKSPDPVHVCRRVDRIPVKTVSTERPNKESGSYNYRSDPPINHPRRVPRQRVWILFLRVNDPVGPLHKRSPSDTSTKSPSPTSVCLRASRTPTQTVFSGSPDKEAWTRVCVSVRWSDSHTFGESPSS